jgi:DNA-binding PadR family transcriptional regulator
MQKTKSNSKPSEDFDLERFAKPQGAPRGLLLHYIMFKISLKPSHGYELLQDIEEKTEGAWRPGPGSIYPLLKRLVAHGYIAEEPSGRLETAHRIYRITPKGLERVEKAKEVFSTAGQKWRAMSRVFLDMIEPKNMAKFCIDSSESNFEITREFLESKLGFVSPSEAEYILNEYSLNLKRQQDWTIELINKLQKSQKLVAHSKSSH